MDDLQFELKGLCARNRDGSFATQQARKQILDLMARQLKEMGFRNMRRSSLKPKHVEALVNRWQAEGLSAGTLKNRLAHLRWWAEKVGRLSVVPAANEALGIAERSFVSEGKQLAVSAEQLDQVTDPYVRWSLRLQEAFGLRREEAMKFKPAEACRQREDGSAYLALTPSWCKGGRAREIPVRTEAQARLLEAVRQFAGKGSLIPPEKRYKDQVPVFERETRKAGISRTHGLRHAYAQRRYQELTGWAAPHAGGPKSKALSLEQKALDHTARLTISAELGHEREQITAVYLGR
jgi:integrase